MNKQNIFIAFLRGINVGGHTIKMDQLKKEFETLGLEKTQTLIASGNVLFESKETDKNVLKGKIETQLKKTFGYEIGVLLRSGEEIQSLVKSDPFKKIKVTPETRLYITFLSEKSTSSLKIPYESPEKDFWILSVTDSEVCSALVVSDKRNTTDIMKDFEKQFGKKITTRNWNTIVKVAKKIDEV